MLKPLTVWITTNCRKFFKRWEYQNVGQEAIIRIRHGTTDWLQIRKGVHQGYILSLCLFKLYTEWVKWVKSLSRVWLFATPWTIAYKAPLSMEFSRQEYWNGLPFPSPGDLPDPGIEPGSPALQADALPSEPPEKSTWCICRIHHAKCRAGWSISWNQDFQEKYQ